MTTLQKILAAVTGAAVNAQFVGLTYRAKGTGEVARHTLMLGVKLEHVYRRDLAVVNKRLQRNPFIAKYLQATREKHEEMLNDIPVVELVRLQALTEIRDSLAESLKSGIGNNSRYTKQGYYTQVLPGVKVSNETGEIYIAGFSRQKKVLQPGTYKVVKSSPLTLCKNEERKSLKCSKFREFVVSADTLETVRANGRELELITK